MNTLKKEHFNLYYIFLEDKKKKPPPAQAIEKIKEKIFSQTGKPPP